MIRRFNYTDRIRILREDILVQLREIDGKLGFEAKLNLQEYDLPPDALVFVEAYRQVSWMRFDFGTVEALTPPKDRALTEFDSPDDILFRVKVTQAQDTHILLAEADRVPLKRPEDSTDKRIPLLPVKPESLADEIYRVDFSDDRPRLLVNKEVGDWRSIAQSPAFASLVYPAVFREVLVHVLIVDGHDDSSDTSDWRALWLKLAESLPGVGQSPSSTDANDDKFYWIDSAVSTFASRLKNRSKFEQYWKKESE